ncbi:MAG TPA: hypothetical protein VK607_17210 [Kofleriaceae bacterium]|nr:hypothetical protein [Kofleriaceae bacterium]
MGPPPETAVPESATADRDERIARALELLAQRESLPSPRRGRDVYTTLIASLVGVLALAISGYTAYVQRAQLRAQVLPHLQVASTEVESRVAFLVLNKGTGPARIDRVRMVVDGKSVKSWAGLAAAVGLTGGDLTWSSLTGVVVSAGQEQTILAPTASEQSRAVFAQWFIGGKHTLAVTICYCSVLDDCWVAGWPAGRAKRDPEVCPITDAQRFDN